MSLKIEICLPDDNVSPTALDAHLDALGFTRGRRDPNTTEPIFYDACVKSETITKEAMDELIKAAVDETPEPAKEPAKATRARKKAEVTQAIQTGDERVNPEEAAQDAADEAAEVAPAAPKAVTVDDLRAAMGNYVNAFDVAAAQADGTAILMSVLGEPPEGVQWKASTVPVDKLGACIDAWNAAAAAGKRFGA